MTLWTDDPAAWAATVTAERRIVDYRVEAVDMAGMVLGPVPVDGVRVSYSGEQAEAWRADFALSDRSLVPTSTRSWLDGRSGVRLRVWWRLLLGIGGGSAYPGDLWPGDAIPGSTGSGASWAEVPCGTYIVEDPKVSDSGLVGITVPGLDPLAVARRGRYGASVIPVGGLTVTAALTRLFGALMPGYPVSIDASTETLPAAYELWDRDPAEDWTEIAAMAGMVVRTDRWGVITVRRQPSPETPAADWQEGPRCPVIDLTSTVKTSTIPRRVVVVSTSPDVTPPVVGVWTNPDADAQMIVTEQRVESSTVTSVAGAESLARLTGERWARPQQSVEVSVPARPDLGYRDLIRLGRVQAAVAGDFRLSGWEMSLSGRDSAPAPMSVTMMTRQ